MGNLYVQFDEGGLSGGLRCLVPYSTALGWVWSESHDVIVSYVYLHTHDVRCTTSFGRVWLWWGQDNDLRAAPGGLSYGSWRADPGDDHLLLGERGWLGFRFWHYESTSFDWRRVAVPYWFLLLLSALLLLLAWRTTRPRPQPQGFPVELATRKDPP